MEWGSFLCGALFGVFACLVFAKRIVNLMISPIESSKKEDDPANWWKHGKDSGYGEADY